MQEIEKQAFMSQYWGQKILYVGPRAKEPQIVNDYFIGLYFINDSYLSLRPLSSITIDEFKDVIKIHEGYAPELIYSRVKTGSSIASPKEWKQFYYTNTENEEVVLGNFTDYDRDQYSVFTGGNYLRCFLQATDYLRSRGFLTGWRNYTPEQLIEMGWVKLHDQPVNNL